MRELFAITVVAVALMMGMVGFKVQAQSASPTASPTASPSTSPVTVPSAAPSTGFGG